MQRKQARAKSPKKAKVETSEEAEVDNAVEAAIRQRDHWAKELFVALVCLGIAVLFVQLAPLPSHDVQKPKDSRSFLTLYWAGELNEIEHITQMLLAATASLLFDTGVVYYHLVNPPHPKFVVTTSRKFSIFTHLISGIVEIITGALAFTIGDPELQHIFAVVMSIASITHALTAYYQTGVVFGAKGVMVPGYLYAITIHITNAYRLFHNPSSLVHLLFTFLVLHIYVWCRFFVLVFRVCNAFAGFQYTLAISFSGLLLFPFPMGPIGNFGMLVIVAVYCALEALLSHKGSVDLIRKLFAEHQRYALVTEDSVSDWKSSVHGDDSDKKVARQVFDERDLNKSGTLGINEINELVTALKIPQLTTSKLLETCDIDHDGQVSFEEFHRFVWNFGTVKGRLTALPKAKASTLDDRQKAKLVFDMLDMNKSGYLGLAELEMLLTQWGLPDHEAEDYLKKYSKDKKRVLFDVFFHQLKPIWSFASDQIFSA